MSASEKLKGLSVTAAGEQRVLNALPQIVAVVEAAEGFRADIPWSSKEELDAALSALERVLDGE